MNGDFILSIEVTQFNKDQAFEYFRFEVFHQGHGSTQGASCSQEVINDDDLFTWFYSVLLGLEDILE